MLEKALNEIRKIPARVHQRIQKTVNAGFSQRDMDEMDNAEQEERPRQRRPKDKTVPASPAGPAPFRHLQAGGAVYRPVLVLGE